MDVLAIQYTNSNARVKMKESQTMDTDALRDRSRWMFLTNHLLVLACLARDPELRIRDLANLVGITERATVQILRQLELSGYLTKTKVGRRNHYTVHGERPLRHPLNDALQVGAVLRVIEPEIPSPAARSGSR
jgi:DNA-binding MarR family transcriptional regulator